MNRDSLPDVAWPSLTRPPIIEAVIDVQVEPDPDAPLDALRNVRTTIAAEYPTLLRGHSETVKLTRRGAGTELSHAREPFGFGFASADRGRIFRARPDGCTFNWVGPYESWERLRDETRRLFDAYRTAARPRRITRVGVRYINRLEFGEGVHLETLTRLHAKLPDELPQMIGAAIVRVVIQFDGGSVANIGSVLEPQPDPAGFAYTLDIDVSHLELDLPPTSPEIWVKLEDLRNTKNKIFFSTLTSEALEPYR